MNGRCGIILLALCLAATAIGGSVGVLLYSLWDLPEVHSLETYHPSVTTRVYSDTKHLLAEFFVENRTPVDLNDVPDMLIKALIAAEDARFYSHHGLDVRGILRAVLRNIRAGRILEGGSTLTQQLAKVLFLTPERSYTRKLKEMALALKIEQQYTKREILAFYLNQIYFGGGAYGIEAAAHTYFGKPARDLTLAECALLAGIPRSPKYYSPFRSRDQAVARRRYVLKRMVMTGMITQAEAESSGRAPIPTEPALTRKGQLPAPYFIEYIRQKVEERFGSSILYTGGLHIYTSINDAEQGYAEEAVRNGIKNLEDKLRLRPTAPGTLEAALVAIDPATGRIRAMVGGRDFSRSQFNRAWQALRQPGSAFKPIVYATALDRGYGPSDQLVDEPFEIKLDARRTWAPENFTRTYQGRVTLRNALAQSLNVPTVRLLSALGVTSVITTARKLGIKSPLHPVLPLALGSSDVTLLELTAAYAVFANQGEYIAPNAILMITDSSGRVLYSGGAPPHQALKPQTAFIITNLLKGVIERGTGYKARELGRPAAGKTGTTNQYRDAWFVGYTPSLVGGVWVGYDDQRSLGPKATGARAALPIWLDFMRHAHQGREPVEFNAPGNLVYRSVDPRNGLLSSDRCRSSLHEAFLPGTEPRRYCEEAGATADEPIAQDEAPE